MVGGEKMWLLLVLLVEASPLLLLVHASCYIHNAKWDKVQCTVGGR